MFIEVVHRLALRSFSEAGPYRLTVRTRPFQGCNRGSIPRKVTGDILSKNTRMSVFTFEYPVTLQKLCGAQFRGESNDGAIQTLSKV